jgi:hypothetical protein
MIIGIAGKKGSGKTTLAKIIKKNTSCVELSFADPIKDMLGFGLNLSNDQLRGDQKEVVDDLYGVTPRHLMQTLGTDWGRSIDPDLWVNIMREKVDPFGLISVVIDDIRYENEADFIREAGVLIHIYRMGGTVDDHSSESGINVKATDTIIYNNGSLQQLEEKMTELKELLK